MIINPQQALAMLSKRTNGILLHPTSLPGPYGSGDFGQGAYQFIDWLKSAGQSYWQMLPLGEIGPGNSPYMSCSAFAGNVLLIDLGDLAKHGWLSESDLIPNKNANDSRVDFSAVIPFRMDRLRRAATAFFANRSELHKDFEKFCLSESQWLNDYALFKTIEQSQNGSGWSYWPNDLATRQPDALSNIAEYYDSEIKFWKFCQWRFTRQWESLKQYANDAGVYIVGDVPIFVAYQSSDVWANRELFELDEAGLPKVVAGVPPDYFSKTGQLWGNPLYSWDKHDSSEYAWWVARLGHALKSFDVVRIDHFRGFSEYWEVPAKDETAMNGRWMPGPGAKLFAAFQTAFGNDLPIIAEDLGLITADVIKLRDDFSLPGMRILQFAFGNDQSNHFLPHHYVTNTVAYTGTHDNDTCLGWWNTLPQHEKEFALKYLNSDGTIIHVDMMKALSASAANTVIFPLQDVLGLSGEHRMNFPGLACGNWEWRFTWAMPTSGHQEFLKSLSIDNNRFGRFKSGV